VRKRAASHSSTAARGESALDSSTGYSYPQRTRAKALVISLFVDAVRFSTVVENFRVQLGTKLWILWIARLGGVPTRDDLYLMPLVRTR
jgi:hypothetical protein